MIYNEVQIQKIMITAVHYDLDGSNLFWRSSCHLLSKVCNGCGPDCLSKSSRAHLTGMLSRYAAAYAIHDVDYESHELSRKSADRRMRKNMIKIWRKDFGFWRWFSFAGIFNRVVVIPSVYSAVRQFGESAWKATKRRLGNEISTDNVGVRSNAHRMPAKRKTPRA